MTYAIYSKLTGRKVEGGFRFKFLAEEIAYAWTEATGYQYEVAEENFQLTPANSAGQGAS